MTQLMKPSRLLNEMPSLLTSFFNDDWFNFDTLWFNRVPAVNIKENDNAFTIEVAAPGMNKQDFQINVESNILTISSEKEEESQEEKKNYRRREYSYQAFSRSFVLPEMVKADDIKATYDNGVLKEKKLKSCPKNR